MNEVSFIARGTPQPKGSGSKTKHGVYIEAGTSDRKLEDGTKILGTRSLKREWANIVYEAAKGLVGAPLDGPLYCVISFCFAAPRSRQAAKKRGHCHSVRPDLDKLVRGVLDPMTKAGLIKDDARIAKITASKQYTDGFPCALVNVGSLWDEP